MKATELIAKLEQLVAEHGDLEVLHFDSEWGGHVAATWTVERDFMLQHPHCPRVWKPNRGRGTPALLLDAQD